MCRMVDYTQASRSDISGASDHRAPILEERFHKLHSTCQVALSAIDVDSVKRNADVYT